MGNYLTRLNKDNEIDSFFKCGSCGDNFYIRREEMAAWAPYDQGKQVNCQKQLSDPDTFFRFPWPDEDNQYPQWHIMQDRVYNRALPLPLPEGVKVPHRQLFQQISKPSDSYTFFPANLPCPLTTDWKLETLKEPDKLIEIWRETQEGTVFRCYWCEVPFYLDQKELTLIRGASISDYGEQIIPVLDRVKSAEDSPT